MKTCFILRLAPARIAIADLTKIRGRVYEVNRINVPPANRGQKHGRELLRMVLAEADRCGVTLRLYPLPSGGLGKRKLIAWYERHGFIKTDSGEVYWYREPVGVPQENAVEQLPF